MVGIVMSLESILDGTSESDHFDDMLDIRAGKTEKDIDELGEEFFFPIFEDFEERMRAKLTPGMTAARLKELVSETIDEMREA
jgi:hypothetical protein